MSGKVHPLHGSQRDAVHPEDTVWLSASAGTGKTQVLSARVLRLLLQPEVAPSQLLCLTFTKAGAAEMAVRVNEVLADWVRLPDAALARDLHAIGAPVDADTLARARTLFARVLDCPGGGLRIDTIHAFSQWLLAAFPHEAGLVPGSRAMEDRDRALLARTVLAELLVDAEARNDEQLLGALELLSLRMGPDAVQDWMLRCADAHDAWFGPGAWQPPLRPRVNQLLGLAADAELAQAAALCADDEFDVESLRHCLRTLSEWDSKTGRDGAQVISDWLARDPAGRLESLGSFFGTLLTLDGRPRQLDNLLKRDPDYGDCAARVVDSIGRVQEFKSLLALAEYLTPALTLGRSFALAWDEAKQREGLIDFDDQIRRAADLLNRAGMAEWIRYKLDRQFDHILVDEAQDTNAAQWDIIDALTGDFFAGEGQRDGKLRTLFVVGDYKQAIFRFQGTSPENFEAARQRVKRAMAGALDNARQARGANAPRPLRELGLGRSFRTSQPVLDFVDRAIASVGEESFGLSGGHEPHIGEDRPGYVALWPPIGAANEDAGDDVDEGEEGWLSRPDRLLADRIAWQVQQWMRDGFPLVKGGARRAGPGDVMVLVRKRKELAGLIVARLYARGVPVAGVDRLRLGAPLAVKDLMAALRFAAQPFDDLNLANLLVSPLVGWSQEQLLEHGWREKGIGLWPHLRASAQGEVQATLARLGQLLALADYEPPQALLHWILVGPWQGRKALVSRLGQEANDPIDELLNAAHAYASAHSPSLQGFIQWFDAGEGDVKREAGAGEGLVRVLTVHGSKGLQAPIVILADATGNPANARSSGLVLDDGGGENSAAGIRHRRSSPVPDLAAADRAGVVAETHARAQREEMEEHWRLLYVAMTRAEEALFIGGSLGSRDRGEPAKGSWYAALAPLFEHEPVADGIWGSRKEWGELAPLPPVRADEAPPAMPVDLPVWAVSPIGPEPRPPRPLAPSSAGEDQSADPPLPPQLRAQAARRGGLIHALLERMPQLPVAERATSGAAWLARHGAELNEAIRQEMLDAALGVLADPRWRDLFGPDALAEVPFAAKVGGQVIAGTVDRLLVTPERLLVVDFKTARRPPERIGEIPGSIVRQMAAYVAALEVIYPGRQIDAALLYTHAPALFALPSALLDPHKQALLD